MKKLIILSLVFLLILSFSSYAIDSCNLSITSGYYNLTKDLNSSDMNATDLLAGEPCFRFTESDVLFDCQGHTIDGDLAISYGFEIWDVKNITLRNCTLSNFVDYGIDMQFVNDSILSDLDILNTSTGFVPIGLYLDGVMDSTFDSLDILGTEVDGIEILFSENNSFSDIMLDSSGEIGLYSEDSLYNDFTGITVSNSGMDGIYLFSSDSNTLANSWITNNSDGSYAGLTIESSSGNEFYNDYFNNTLNVEFLDPGNTNSWNTSLDCSAGNILGMSCLGGNFWAYPNGTGFSETCTSAGDGICSENYTLDIGNTDYLPLTRNMPPPINITSFYPANRSFNVSENSTVDFNISYSDSQGPVTITWLLDDEEKSSFTNLTGFNVTFNFTSSGDHNVTVLVSDDTSDADLTWDIEVLDLNLPVRLISNISDQRWYADQNSTIDLSLYFEDIDHDGLTYTYPDIANIAVNISGDLAEFDPDNNFTGNRTIWFNASDGSSTVRSNNVTLFVTYDLDGDGLNSTLFNGTDCNDTDASIYPGASCERDCYDGSTYDAVCECTGGSYTCGGGSSGGGGGGAPSTLPSSEVSYRKSFAYLQAGRMSTIALDKKIAITNITFVPDDYIAELDLEIRLEENISDDMKLAGSYQYDEIIADYDGDDLLSDINIWFRVNRSWIDENGYAPGMTALMRYVDGWDELPTELIGQDSEYYYYRSSTSAFSYFAVVGEVEESEPVEPEQSEPIDEVEEPADEPENEPPAVEPDFRNQTNKTDHKEEGSGYWLPVLLVIFIAVVIIYLFIRKR